MLKNKLVFCLLIASVSLATAQDLNNYQSVLKAWNQPVKPFQIIGNIYYVGTNNLACYVIKTNAGLILLDTALQESVPLVKANIEALGFKLKDIKIMLSSHAHFDHVAGHAGQPDIKPLKLDGQPGVFDAEKPHHGGVEIVHIDGIIHR